MQHYVFDKLGGSHQKQFASSGMTLVEVIVVTALFALIILAIGDTIASFYRYHSYTISQSYQVSHARRGIEAMVRDIREMTFADNGTFPLSTMNNNSIGFYSDIDRDDSVEYVTYTLSGTVLTKNVFNATGTPATYNLSTPDDTYIISEYVQNINQATSTFRYFTNTNTPITSTSTVTDVQYVEVQLIVNIDPIRDPGEFTLRSSASLRNLKNN